MSKTKSLRVISFDALAVVAVIAALGFFAFSLDQNLSDVKTDPAVLSLEARKVAAVKELKLQCQRQDFVCIQQASLHLADKYFPATEGYTHQTRQLMHKAILDDIKK